MDGGTAAHCRGVYRRPGSGVPVRPERILALERGNFALPLHLGEFPGRRCRPQAARPYQRGQPGDAVVGIISPAARKRCRGAGFWLRVAPVVLRDHEPVGQYRAVLHHHGVFPGVGVHRCSGRRAPSGLVPGTSDDRAASPGFDLDRSGHDHSSWWRHSWSSGRA